MKITFLLTNIGISGGNRSIFEIANRLHDKGHDVSIIYPFLPSSKRKNLFDPKKMTGRIFRLLKNIKQGNSLTWFDLRAQLIRVPTFSERYIPEADIIVATWWSTAFNVNSYGPDKGVNFYLVRGYEGYEKWGEPTDLADKSYTFPLHKIVCATWLEDMIEKKFNVPVLEVLPNGVNFDIFHLERENFKCHQPKRVGILYRGLELKGAKDALEAILETQKEFPDIQAVLFGEEPNARDEEIIKKIKHVEFHKLPYKDDLRKIYNSLDIFVFPSHFEGFPNPPMEAMACGAACISTQVGAVLDYTIPDKTAIIVPPQKVKDMAGAVKMLLSDEEKRQKIAEEGYKHIQRFTWDKTVNRLEEIFTAYFQKSSKV